MAATTLANPQRGTGVLLLVGSCFSLQLGASVAHGLFPHASSWGVTAVRLAVAALILLALSRPAIRTWDRQTWISVALLGVTLGAMNGFFYAAIARLPLGVAVTIEFLGPLLLAAALSRRIADIGWVLLAFTGIGLLGLNSFMTSDVLDPIGVGFVLCAAAMWACYILAGAKASNTMPGMGGLAVAFAIGAAVNAVPGFSGARIILTTPDLLWPALLTGLLGSLVPYSLEFLALRRLSRPVFGVLMSLEPVFAALVGWIVLSQELSPLQWLAVAAVIAATVGNTLSSSERNPGATDVENETSIEVMSSPQEMQSRGHEKSAFVDSESR